MNARERGQAANALKHGLTAKLFLGADPGEVETLSLGILVGEPRTPAIESLARDAALAILHVQEIDRVRAKEIERALRVVASENAARRDESLLFSFWPADFDGDLDADDEAPKRASRDDLDMMNRAYAKLPDVLKTLGNYERKAVSRMRRAFRLLDLEIIETLRSNRPISPGAAE